MNLASIGSASWEEYNKKATHHPSQDMNGTGIISHQPFKKPEMEHISRLLFLALSLVKKRRNNKCESAMKIHQNQSLDYLVGGFNHPFEKYARQNGNLPQIEVKIKHI